MFIARGLSNEVLEGAVYKSDANNCQAFLDRAAPRLRSRTEMAPPLAIS